MSAPLLLSMEPAPGASQVAYVGDRLRLAVTLSEPDQVAACLLRCTFGSAGGDDDALPLWENMGQWQDLPMYRDGDSKKWIIDVPLIQPGWYQAKALAIDHHGQRHWPQGANVQISVHPVTWRSGNTIYCAFTRMHGASRHQRQTTDSLRDEQLAVMDQHGWTVIPPSGTLRDLATQIPHITHDLRCRIIHLLPINPTPTTHARYGRFGSPYAATDFTSIDPALVVHDRKTTALDQFQELVDAIHGHGARLIIDLAINHTGWNSTLQNEHPEWFKRATDGHFESPGAWGTVWEDLTELDHSKPALWEHLAEVFLVWCRRGVDGFRCDAGYMVPLPAWRLITQRVRKHFPNTLFLLEGLGGGWQDTANLLQSGGMQWAYSELFQNYAPHEVGAYLDHCQQASREVGVLVHYSETHDNQRLAAYDPNPQRAKRWSLLRNRLSALTAVAGAYGFTAGVEWLADEKLNVHNSRGLNWGARDNLIAELNQLNHLLGEHPCFLETSSISRISSVDTVIYGLKRCAASGETVVIFANLDLDHAQQCPLPTAYAQYSHNLLGEEVAITDHNDDQGQVINLAPGQVVCLSDEPWQDQRCGSIQRKRQLLASVAMAAIHHYVPLADFGPGDPLLLGDLLAADPGSFVAALPFLDPSRTRQDIVAALKHHCSQPHYPCVTHWQPESAPRITVVPTHHWLCVNYPRPFRWCLQHCGGELFGDSFPLADGRHGALVSPQSRGEALLQLQAQGADGGHHQGQLRFSDSSNWPGATCPQHDMVLLTNGRGGMSRMAVDLGSISSKYDAALAANLHPQWPVDRHVLLKRFRAWADADGFFAPLTAASLRTFSNDEHSAHWQFRVACGNQRWIDIHLQAWMPAGSNTLCTRWWRGDGDRSATLTLIVRPDLEDRSFHGETQRSTESERHFRHHLQGLEDGQGCLFQPSDERRLEISGPAGTWNSDEEWSHCQHPIEADRGQTAAGDAWSPGYFKIPLAIDGSAQQSSRQALLIFNAELQTPSLTSPASLAIPHRPQPSYSLEQRLLGSVSAFLVRREDGKTVIAGYPWFLDWGRDTLICARGYLAAGQHEAVRDLLRVFGRFEEHGTLPNIIHGDHVGNRDTVDAPLWYGVVCEEFAQQVSPDIYDLDLGNGRVVREVLTSIAVGYLNGTANGVHTDPETALVWSPSHFTWMDTNYPAGTPRRGYPIEIQALWIRLLRQLGQLEVEASHHGPWLELAERAQRHLDQLFWLPEHGWWADCLIAESGVGARKAIRDTALRSNAVLPIALGILNGSHARRTLLAIAHHLVVPGALRSLAPLRVEPGLPIRAADGQLLNDPHNPYQGRYEGDEDSRRKPAYHNGTAWTWTFPGFCEALVTAWPDDPQAHEAALAYLTSCDELLERGCLGQMPEIVDGNRPHRQRGCDAQAWGATEALRVLRRLNNA